MLLRIFGSIFMFVRRNVIISAMIFFLRLIFVEILAVPIIPFVCPEVKLSELNIVRVKISIKSENI